MWQMLFWLYLANHTYFLRQGLQAFTPALARIILVSTPVGSLIQAGLTIYLLL